VLNTWLAKQSVEHFSWTAWHAAGVAGSEYIMAACRAGFFYKRGNYPFERQGLGLGEQVVHNPWILMDFRRSA